MIAMAQSNPDQDSYTGNGQKGLLRNSRMIQIARKTATTDSDDDVQIDDWRPPTAHKVNKTNHALPQDTVAAATTEAENHRSMPRDKADHATSHSS